jgi:hypothetical protein
MDEQAVRARAEAFGAALVAGDVERAIGDLSPALRQNIGEVLALFPLPATAAAVDGIERTATGFAVNLRLVGASEEVVVQTRWKDRDGEPTIVETSHLSRVETPQVAELVDGEEGTPGGGPEGEA